jgi:hydroxyacylglutathione hydrolase
MIIKKIPAGVYAANCYIVMDEETRETAVIDPGGDSDELFSVINELNSKVKYILLTHGHADHTGAVKDFINKYKVPLCVNKRDWDLMASGEFMFGEVDFLGKGFEYIEIEDGKSFNLGKESIECIETPGHTPGGMSFLIQKHLFTGDTLFFGSIGRTDLAGGDFDTLITSIKTKLLHLEPDTMVYPGHGPSSTVDREKNNNPFLR